MFVPHASENWTKSYGTNYMKCWTFWQKTGVFKTIFDKALTPFWKTFLWLQQLFYAKLLIQTTIFQCSKKFGSPTHVTRLKVVLNMAYPNGIKDSHIVALNFKAQRYFAWVRPHLKFALLLYVTLSPTRTSDDWKWHSTCRAARFVTKNYSRVQLQWPTLEQRRKHVASSICVKFNQKGTTAIPNNRPTGPYSTSRSDHQQHTTGRPSGKILSHESQ